MPLWRWRMNESAQAFLVALNISGFSNDPDADQLWNHRMNFFHAVEHVVIGNRSHACVRALRHSWAGVGRSRSEPVRVMGAPSIPLQVPCRALSRDRNTVSL